MTNKEFKLPSEIIWSGRKTNDGASKVKYKLWANVLINFFLFFLSLASIRLLDNLLVPFFIFILIFLITAYSIVLIYSKKNSIKRKVMVTIVFLLLFGSFILSAISYFASRIDLSGLFYRFNG